MNLPIVPDSHTQGLRARQIGFNSWNSFWLPANPGSSWLDELARNLSFSFPAKSDFTKKKTLKDCETALISDCWSVMILILSLNGISHGVSHKLDHGVSHVIQSMTAWSQNFLFFFLRLNRHRKIFVLENITGISTGKICYQYKVPESAPEKFVLEPVPEQFVTESKDQSQQLKFFWVPSHSWHRSWVSSWGRSWGQSKVSKFYSGIIHSLTTMC